MPTIRHTGDTCCPGNQLKWVKVGRRDYCVKCLECGTIWMGRQMFVDGNPTVTNEWIPVLASYTPGDVLVDE